MEKRNTLDPVEHFDSSLHKRLKTISQTFLVTLYIQDPDQHYNIYLH